MGEDWEGQEVLPESDWRVISCLSNSSIDKEIVQRKMLEARL
jgi:hypothetical protein